MWGSNRCRLWKVLEVAQYRRRPHYLNNESPVPFIKICRINIILFATHLVIQYMVNEAIPFSTADYIHEIFITPLNGPHLCDTYVFVRHTLLLCKNIGQQINMIKRNNKPVYDESNNYCEWIFSSVIVYYNRQLTDYHSYLCDRKGIIIIMMPPRH